MAGEGHTSYLAGSNLAGGEDLPRILPACLSLFNPNPQGTHPLCLPGAQVALTPAGKFRKKRFTVGQLELFDTRHCLVATSSATGAPRCLRTMFATPWVCRSCLRSATRLTTAQFIRRASTGNAISSNSSLPISFLLESIL